MGLGPRTQIHVLCKSNKGSWPLSHLCLQVILFLSQDYYPERIQDWWLRKEKVAFKILVYVHHLKKKDESWKYLLWICYSCILVRIWLECIWTEFMFQSHLQLILMMTDKTDPLYQHLVSLAQATAVVCDWR